MRIEAFGLEKQKEAISHSSRVKVYDVEKGRIGIIMFPLHSFT